MSEESEEPNRGLDSSGENSSSGRSDDSTQMKDPMLGDAGKQYESIIQDLEVKSNAFRAILDLNISLKKNNDALLAERAKLKGQLDLLILEHESLQKSIKTLQDEMEGVKSEYNDIKTRYKASLTEHERLVYELEELQKIYSVAKQYLDKAKVVEDENMRLRTEMESSFSSKEVESLRNELEQMRVSHTNLERSLLDSHKAAEVLSKEYESLKNKLYKIP